MTAVGDARRESPCVAIDIGATKVEVALVSPEGDLRRRVRLAVADHEANLFESIVAAVLEVHGTDGLDVVGVGCAGPMTRGGLNVSPLNIPVWRAFPLRDSLRDALGVPVFVEGDARALALAEGSFGGARDVTSYLSMVVSTGVGGGVVLDGRLIDGATGNAGHVGHLNVVRVLRLPRSRGVWSRD
jgi:glucokinase